MREVLEMTGTVRTVCSAMTSGSFACLGLACIRPGTACKERKSSATVASHTPTCSHTLPCVISMLHFGWHYQNFTAPLHPTVDLT